MKGHAATISNEVRRMMESLGDEGEIDLLDFFSELTIYTSTACLIGKEFREEMNAEYYQAFYDLEKGTDAWAFVNPHLPLRVFRARDRARKRLVTMLSEVFERRRKDPSAKRELFDHLLAVRDEDGNATFPIDRITGLFISLMFAGHHTTSGTAAWTLIELLSNPTEMKSVVSELDATYGEDREVSFEALRELHTLESSINEALRLHPPLILLMRKVMQDFHYKGYTVPAGMLVGVSPAISNRLPECFPEPSRFDPSRYEKGREEDKQLFTWIPFGAGRHRCVGAAFAMMQLKAIFADLLRHFEFELSQPPSTYRNDHSKMVVQLAKPCRVRYRRRHRATAQTSVRSMSSTPRAAGVSNDASDTVTVRVDLDLCQGHSVCVSEAPELFEIERIDGEDKVVLKSESVGPELREKLALAVEHCPTRALSVDER